MPSKSDDPIKSRQIDGCVKSSPAVRGISPAIPLRAGLRLSRETFYEAFNYLCEHLVETRSLFPATSSTNLPEKSEVERLLGSTKRFAG